MFRIDFDVFIQQFSCPVNYIIWSEFCLASWLNTERFLCVFDQTLHVNWQVNVLVEDKDVLSKLIAIPLNLLKFCFELFTHFVKVRDFIDGPLLNGLFHLESLFLFVRFAVEELVLFGHFTVVHFQMRNSKVLNILSCKTVFSVQELNDLILGVSYRAIVLDLDVFKSLDESALDVACLCSFTGCIN